MQESRCGVVRSIRPSRSRRTPQRLRDALRQARIESAERTGVIVDLRDAEIARLELLNEALDPLFEEIPDNIEMFDRGIARGDTPRLWIDVIAHVDMGRDKRTYRFVQDSRYGRTMLAESPRSAEIVEAVTKYVARRIVERERALAADERLLLQEPVRDARSRRRARWRAFRAFVFGLLLGIAAVVGTLALLVAQPARLDCQLRCRAELDDAAGVGAKATRHRLAAARRRAAARRCDRDCRRRARWPAVGRRRRGRRHAERRDRAARPVEPVERMDVIVAVQHQLGADARAARRAGRRRRSAA